ncbi:hypothetical protein HDU88_002667 [Geranomyces variabilis]|nr:hypothetical protein HDU88_002667 [Geranomyces variabilis]
MVAIADGLFTFDEYGVVKFGAIDQKIDIAASFAEMFLIFEQLMLQTNAAIKGISQRVYRLIKLDKLKKRAHGPGPALIYCGLL